MEITFYSEINVEYSLFYLLEHKLDTKEIPEGKVIPNIDLMLLGKTDIVVFLLLKRLLPIYTQ